MHGHLVFAAVVPSVAFRTAYRSACEPRCHGTDPSPDLAAMQAQLQKHHRWLTLMECDRWVYVCTDVVPLVPGRVVEVPAVTATKCRLLYEVLLNLHLPSRDAAHFYLPGVA